jgi:hypothetical protein
MRSGAKSPHRGVFPLRNIPASDGDVNRRAKRTPFRGDRHPNGTALLEKRPAYLCNRLHDQHPNLDFQKPRKPKPIKAICRELGVSRKVVRKVIRSGATEFRYQREDQPLPKIGRWRDALDQLLAQNETKSSRERLTLIRLFEELRGRGYDGGYDAVRRYARRWAQERGQATAAAFVPLSFAPGEAYQFDWSHEIVLLSGATVTVKVAHVRLCHSRMLFSLSA